MCVDERKKRGGFAYALTEYLGLDSNAYSDIGGLLRESALRVIF